MSVTASCDVDLTVNGIRSLAGALGLGDGSVPPTLAFVVGYPALRGCVARLAADRPPSGILHLRQYLALHRPPRPGSRLTTEARLARVVRAPGGTMVSVRSRTCSTAGDLLAEAEAVMLLLGVEYPAVAGPGPRTLAAPRTGEPGTVVHRVDAGQPARYAAASGDDNPVHLDDRVAEAAGLPGRVVHGMASLGYALRAVEEVHDAVAREVGPLAEVACRFVGSMRPGGELRTTVWTGRTPGERPADTCAVFHAEGPDGAVLEGTARHTSGSGVDHPSDDRSSACGG